MQAFNTIICNKVIDNNRTESGAIIIKRGTPTEDEYNLIQFDGLSAPNPGKSTSGAVIFSQGPNRRVMLEAAHYIEYANNNEAEYGGLILGLEQAKLLGIKNILIEGDSETVIYQTEGRFRTIHSKIVLLQEVVKELLKSFNFVAIRHIKREFNKHADSLSNECLSLGKSFNRTIIQ